MKQPGRQMPNRANRVSRVVAYGRADDTAHERSAGERERLLARRGERLPPMSSCGTPAGRHAGLGPGRVVPSVHAVLARFAAPQLLIVDNAADMASVAALLPPAGPASRTIRQPGAGQRARRAAAGAGAGRLDQFAVLLPIHERSTVPSTRSPWPSARENLADFTGEAGDAAAP